MRNVFLDNPISVQVPMEFKRLSGFIQLAFRRKMFTIRFLNLIIADRPAGGFDEPGIDGTSFIDSESLGFELTKNMGVDLLRGVFGKLSLKRENVE